ncbi:beta-1,4-glucuronyltransferase 1 [Heterodontus francisci]|uniref:beta-1,4-glucuronyltransferase 1 n=1 Tax=Heterodontus francisci TaxID=7792 RepID=UPI00355B3EEC
MGRNMPLLPVKCSLFKAVLSALLLVAALQLVYLALLSGLHGRQQRRRYSQLFEGPEPRGRAGEAEGDGEVEEEEEEAGSRSRRQSLVRALQAGGSLDASGQYRLYRDVTRSPVAARGSPGLDFSLATHSSVHNLHHLPGLVRRWQAPVSVALFAPAGDAAEALLTLHRLGLHCPGVQELVTFTLVTFSRDPVTFPEAGPAQAQAAWDPGLDLDAEPEPHAPCRRALGPLHRLRRRHRNYALANASYPNNLLRNAARRGLPSRYVAVIDMDMLPSGGLHRLFLELVSGPGPRPGPDPGRTVFVLPALEMRHSRRLPADKPELQRLYQVGEVRPFYDELCPRCQAPTNYTRWINLPTGPGLGVAYTLDWTDPWEPFYVGLASVPPYDERFKQYGFNRISQACELHVAGYTFAVLDNAFLIHKGFKLASEFHPQKDEENRRNRMLFRQFKQELKVKYSESPHHC